MHKKITHLLREKLIGTIITIPEKNLAGKVIDETKHTITILTKQHERKMMEKKNNTFQLHRGTEMIEVHGALFIGRPEERIKKTR